MNVIIYMATVCNTYCLQIFSYQALWSYSLCQLSIALTYSNRFLLHLLHYTSS